ncbi:uroporphyrinogen-III synthase [Magnetospirillum molischianum]|uniref:Uroporphyrinogen-III synthase n=1 Tax=Magnetospirillum molischianum DSM 120 TaxID=1150626 RepID=H8FTY6_MAGML|nr:uroporphyrinogen-III synthase [Magnetospirillum molischianum]CCG41843.1 Uroporphyrinogen-III synthase [Magnetospirillum molischianum DSM 120]
MVKALVTRPKEDAEPVSRALTDRGIAVMTEPLLRIESVPGVSVDTAGLQGLLVTSANGARALARLLPDRTLPVWAVGDGSARVAREMGFVSIEYAGGDVGSLTNLVLARVDPTRGALLHAAGENVAGDLSGCLNERGYRVRREVLYRAVPATGLSPELCRALQAGEIDLALFFSPRTAATFATLVNDAGLGEMLARVEAYGLSGNVTAKLNGLPWAALHRAAEPTLAALLAAVDENGRPS